ncbi:hypothetical protein NKG05_07120 [Oerskovia sp. M15]
MATGAQQARGRPAAETEETGPVTIRFSWWGSDTRHEVTQQIIDLFEAENPDITVVGDFTDWGGYWDKLSTTVAAATPPTSSRRRSATSRTTRAAACWPTCPSWTSTRRRSTRVWSSPVRSRAGCSGSRRASTPTRSWQTPGVRRGGRGDARRHHLDVGRLRRDGQRDLGGSPEGTYGAQDYGFNEPGFSIWARQRGEALYNEDGTLGYDEATLAEWWQTSLDVQAGGGQADAARSIELDAGGPEQSLLGTNTGAMGVWWTNQLGAISSAAGRDLELLRFPGESEFERTGMYFKPPCTTRSPRRPSTRRSCEARGLPPQRPRGRGAHALRPRDAGEHRGPRSRPGQVLPGRQAGRGLPRGPRGRDRRRRRGPAGRGGEVVEIIRRLNTEVLFGRMTPEAAAAQFTQEVEAATAG